MNTTTDESSNFKSCSRIKGSKVLRQYDEGIVVKLPTIQGRGVPFIDMQAPWKMLRAKCHWGLHIGMLKPTLSIRAFGDPLVRARKAGVWMIGFYY